MGKNKKLILFIILSLTLNLYFLYKEFEIHFAKKIMDEVLVNYTVDKSKNFELELANFYAAHPDKNYILISTWADWCAPCIKEMPVLDSLLRNYNHLITGFFITDVTKPKNKFNDLKFKNFQLLYYQNDLISAIHNKYSLKEKCYPLNIVVDRNKNVYFFNSKGIDLVNDTSLNTTLKAISEDFN